MERRLVLCRHTQTDHNRDRVYTGQLDVPVNAQGARQAKVLAENIAELSGICGIITSDLRRTKYLARRISQLTTVRPNVLWGLRETHLGDLQGLTKDEVVQRYPDRTFRTSNPEFDFRSVGGECAPHVIARQIAALQEATPLFGRGANGVRRLVVVGHGTALRLLFEYHLGLIGQLHEQGGYQEVPWPF